MNSNFLGNIYGHGAGYAGAVWDKEAISPTLTTMQGGGREPMIIESKEIGTTHPSHGWLPENADFSGIAPTIDAGIWKHHTLLIEKEAMEMNKLGYIENGTGQHQSNTVYGTDGLCPNITTIEGGGTQQIKIVDIKQATKQGAIPCKIGGVADLNYPDSTTRRGRVQGNGEICPTLTTENIPSVLEPWIWEIDGIKYLIRIRKLTPRECWRLMDFSDTDFNKAQEVNSNTQLYKQAGNSIVRNVLCEVFRQLL